jgi:RNA polymerase-binding transcription factor DksA
MPQRIIKKIQELRKKEIEKRKKIALDKKRNVGALNDQYVNQEKILKKKEKQLQKQLTHIARKRKSIKGDYRARFPFFGRGKDEDAQEVTQYESRLSIEHQLETELEKVQRAIKNISDGKYGICKACEKIISSERLKIYPEAEHCMGCHRKGL